MTDIVERLRQFQDVFKGPNFAKAYHDMGNEIGEAAEEIERLRVALRESSLREGLREAEVDKLTTLVTALRGILREMLKPIKPTDKDDIERFMREGDEIARRARAILENE